ncbi:MAG: Ribosomal RNA small subunit methyltransferase I [Eubacteriales bacterium SKADARSKE-1]|nr:Ribosomal RNA small subunit methyltransferase I [Eubacteriales bacterium SKADARSKE-1]
MVGKLIIVGTPIGNLSDISQRAKDTLNNVDFIAAEDTRVTLKLLRYLGIKKPMISYFEHNKYQKGEFICEKILNGQTCALVSDAGMPAISDPGEELVSMCAEKNIQVSVVPGPSALTAALAVSGLPTGRFTFEGFLSVNKKSRKEHLLQLKFEPRTMIFYEAPHKLYRTLCDLNIEIGDRKIAIVREISKIYEEVIRTTLREACARYENEKVKGEIVLVVDGYKNTNKEIYTLEEAVNLAKEVIDNGSSASEAAKEASKVTGIKKSDIYQLIVRK